MISHQYPIFRGHLVARQPAVGRAASRSLSSPGRWLPAALVTLAVLFSTVIRADVVEDVYAAQILVTDRSAGSLREARRAGLAEVFVKASGDPAAAAEEALAPALASAERFVLGYSYEDAGDAGIYVRIAFDQSAVQASLADAGLPVWTANRPTILTWLVLDRGPQRVFASALDAPAAQSALAESFSRRGVPLQTPLFDLQDTAAISAGEAWRFSSAALISASARYRGSELLAGRAAQLSSGEWVGDWRLLDQGQWVNLSVTAASLEAFTDTGADLVARTLAARYAVRSVAGQSDQRHRIVLRGIRSYAAYMSLQQALASFEAVRRVVPEELLGDQVSLRIEADADSSQLARIIELDPRFARIPADPGESGLVYEWIE